MGYSIFIEETKGGETKFRAVLHKNLTPQSVKTSNDFKEVLNWYNSKRLAYPGADCFIQTNAAKIISFPIEFSYEGVETKFSTELYGFELGKAYTLLKGNTSPAYVEMRSPTQGGISAFPFQCVEPAESGE